MRRSLLALAITGATFAACTQAAPTEQPVPAPAAEAAAAPVEPVEDVEAVVTQLERDWVAAIVKKDEAAIERLLAEDFAGTSPTAHTFNKGIALADLKSGKYVVESMDLDEISVNVYGETAVVFTSQQEKSTYDGKDVSGHYHFTDVWVKRDGRWQVVASHGSRFGERHS
jgi:ketosteroid isomerase-like protein